MKITRRPREKGRGAWKLLEEIGAVLGNLTSEVKQQPRKLSEEECEEQRPRGDASQSD